MIEHRNTLISEDIFEKRFVCDLNACKGACCVAGRAVHRWNRKKLIC